MAMTYAFERLCLYLTICCPFGWCTQSTLECVALLLPPKLEIILAIDPEEWTHEQVLVWLKQTHDGRLSDLVPAFKKHKISGVSFTTLTADKLKNDMDIIALGDRDLFIRARDKVLADHRQHNDSEPHNSSEPLNPSGVSPGTVSSNPTDSRTDGDKKESSNNPHIHSDAQSSQPPAHEISDRGITSPPQQSPYPHPSPDDNGVIPSNPHQYSVDTTAMSMQNVGPLGTLQVNKTLPSTVIHHPHNGGPFHQTTPSNNHLITKPPSSMRHNRSFDDTANGANGQMIAPQSSPFNGGGGGYEEIPDTFSPSGGYVQNGGSRPNLNGNVNAIGFAGTMPQNGVYPVCTLHHRIHSVLYMK